MPFVRLKPKGSTFSMVTKGRRVLPLKSRQSEAGVRRRAFAPLCRKGTETESAGGREGAGAGISHVPTLCLVTSLPHLRQKTREGAGVSRDHINILYLCFVGPI